LEHFVPSIELNPLQTALVTVKNMNKHLIALIAFILLILTLIFPLAVNAQTSSTQTPTESTCVDKASLPTARAYPGAAVVDGKIYVIGGRTESLSTHGFGANEMYDPATNTWTAKAPMPSCRGLFGIAVYQNKIYCIGGEYYNRGPPGTVTVGTVEVYDPQTDTWENKSSMPTARNRPQLSVVDGKIYALGGINTPNVNEVYDPAADSWTTKANVPSTNSQAIYTGVSAVINDQIYWFNKEGENSNLQLHCRLYNPQQDRWTELPPLTNSTDTSGFYFTAVIGAKGSERIYLLGSESNITCYVPSTDQCILEPKAFPARIGYAFAVVDDSFYIIGGSEQFLSDTAKNQQFTPSSYTPNVTTQPVGVSPVWIGVAAAIVGCTAIAVVIVYHKKNRR
jgi:N-acetylneuraminic acid mutarotase